MVLWSLRHSLSCGSWHLVLSLGVLLTVLRSLLLSVRTGFYRWLFPIVLHLWNVSRSVLKATRVLLLMSLLRGSHSLHGLSLSHWSSHCPHRRLTRLRLLGLLIHRLSVLALKHRMVRRKMGRYTLLLIGHRLDTFLNFSFYPSRTRLTSRKQLDVPGKIPLT